MTFAYDPHLPGALYCKVPPDAGLVIGQLALRMAELSQCRLGNYRE